MLGNAWHFTGKTLRNGEKIPPIGKWLEFKGEVRMCESGLHAARTPWQALSYAPGHILHRVEVADVVDEGSDKLVCRRRKIVASIDLKELLIDFACDKALEVLHLWEPDVAVIDYLSSRDPGLAAAKAAANAAYVAYIANVAANVAYDAAYTAYAAAYAAYAAYVAANVAYDAAYAAYVAAYAAANAAYAANAAEFNSRVLNEVVWPD